MNKCLCCYKALRPGEIDFHKGCAKRMFGAQTAPTMPYTRGEIGKLAQIVVEKHTTVTGVQAKLSLDLDRDESGLPMRFTIVGVMGRYILKPQTERFTCLPEMEDLTMHLAEAARIATVPHALIRFADGELNYITRRIDRTDDGAKLAMEDFCQLSEHLTEHKYNGSYEMVAMLIKRYSAVPRFDLANFWEQVVFAWIVGNADMHLKNFSLISRKRDTYVLSPTYDQVSTAIVMPEDTEELALSLNGWKKKLMRDDFMAGMVSTGLDQIVANRILDRFQKCSGKWNEIIDMSFVTDEQKEGLKALIKQRLVTLGKKG